MAAKIMKSAILPASRYKDDWLSHRNLKIHSNGVNYNTRAFAKSQGSLMPRIASKNRGPNNPSHLTVFCYFFVFFTNQTGLSNSTILVYGEKSFPTSLFFFIHLHHFAERPM